MFERILEWWNEFEQGKQKLVIGVVTGALFVLLLSAVIFGMIGKNGSTSDSPSSTNSEVTETESENSEFTEETSSETETEMESESESESDSQEESEIVEKEDPQSSVGGNMTNQNGASVDISQVVDKAPANETQEVTLGIDVA